VARFTPDWGAFTEAANGGLDRVTGIQLYMSKTQGVVGQVVQRQLRWYKRQTHGVGSIRQRWDGSGEGNRSLSVEWVPTFGKRGQFLILFTTRPASSGDTRDGSDNRACPSPDARRSTPPSSSSPPASPPLKPPSLNPHLGRVLRSASCHRPSFNSVAMISSASASAVVSDGVKTNKTCRFKNH